MSAPSPPPPGPPPPHAQSASLRDALASVPTTAWRGRIIRGVSFHLATQRDLPTGMGAMLHGGRWNPRGLPVLYGSLEMTTALAELLAWCDYYGLPETAALPCVWVAFDVDLERAVDLREPGTLRKLRVSRKQLLAEPWRDIQARGAEALTQSLGREADGLGIEGILVPSARSRKGNNVVVLNPARLPRGRVILLNREQFPRLRRKKP